MTHGLPGLTPDEGYRRLLQGYFALRVLVLTLFLGGTLLYQLQGRPPGHWPDPHYFYFLIAASYLQALLSLLAMRWLRGFRGLVQIQVAWDLLFVTAILYLTGGIESLFPFLFLLVILSAALLLTRRDVLIVAAAAAILYGSLIDLQYFKLLPVLPGISFAEHVAPYRALYAVFVHVSAFFAVAMLAASLVGRLRHSEVARQQAEDDFAQLGLLNHTILANMPSGLMIIDLDGCVKSANPAAEEMLGVTLEQLKDQPAGRFFPALEVPQEGRFRLVERAEGTLCSGSGLTRPIGYNTSLVNDPDGKLRGLLVTFQDLSRLKEMEERLKRADRLAAVGHLAAGMAHEIRNPLASISGSVQLLSESLAAGEEDRHLLGIVVREAGRLSQLLSDFLQFARPVRPDKASCDPAALLDDLKGLVGGDPRFAHITLKLGAPSGHKLLADRRQLQQALWNLLINAAEAMPAGGELRLAFEPQTQSFIVEDSGHGVADALREKIFDPFFTTKDHGTGLGLSTVYAIVTAHGGTLDLATSSLGGAKFIIRLKAEG